MDTQRKSSDGSQNLPVGGAVCGDSIPHVPASHRVSPPGGQRGEHEPGPGSLLELPDRLPVDAGGVQCQPTTELPQQALLLLGEDAVGHGVGDVALPALLEGLVDGGAVGVVAAVRSRLV